MSCRGTLGNLGATQKVENVSRKRVKLVEKQSILHQGVRLRLPDFWGPGVERPRGTHLSDMEGSPTLAPKESK